MKNYGHRLAVALKQRKLTQYDLAEKLNLPRSAVSKIVTGRQFLNFDLAIEACEFLGITLDWLAYGRDIPREAVYYSNPDRQRIEYLMTILRESEYPTVIVALEGVIELREKGRETKPASDAGGAQKTG